MSHLGERVTALVDGQLPPDVAERAFAHTAGCRPCREALELERLTKARLGALPDLAPGPELIATLLVLGGPDGPLPPRAGRLPERARTAGDQRVDQGRLVGAVAAATISARAAQGGGLRPSGVPRTAGLTDGPRRSLGPVDRPRTLRGTPVRRGRRAAVALLGVVGLAGVGMIGMLGEPSANGPTVVPPVDSFVMQHAATTRDLPFAGTLIDWSVKVEPTSRPGK